jgi:hypothetical protein
MGQKGGREGRKEEIALNFPVPTGTLTPSPFLREVFSA